MEIRYLQRLALALGVAAIFAASCGGDSSVFPEDAIAIRVSNDIGLGQERLLIGVATVDGSRLGSPEEPVSFEVAPVDEPAATQSVAATFTWILEDVTGLYRAELDFDRAGVWQVTVKPDGGAALDPVLFNVAAEPFAPALGAMAPAAPTPTLDDFAIEQLTTDDEPDLDFYKISLEDSIASAMPTVLVFSTPAYCQTAACGPLLHMQT